MRRRLDVEMVRRGLVSSRAHAQSVIDSGRVLVSGAIADKAARMVSAAEPLEVITPAPRYVSRGGEKLEAALVAFALDPSGRVCLDVGAATGGFTDCLLQHGALRVITVDVGPSQLHERIRSDPRVEVRDRTNARALDPADFPLRASLASIDVSFIGAAKVTGAVHAVVTPNADVVLLVKPQFETRGHAGVIRNDAIRKRALDSTLLEVAGQGYTLCRVIKSPLRGGARGSGNIEYLAHLRA